MKQFIKSYIEVVTSLILLYFSIVRLLFATLKRNCYLISLASFRFLDVVQSLVLSMKVSIRNLPFIEVEQLACNKLVSRIYWRGD